MAKKGKAKSLDNSQHVFHSRSFWDMPWRLFNFYPSGSNVAFHISPEKIKVHSFFHKQNEKNVIMLKVFKVNKSVFTNKTSTLSVLILSKINVFSQFAKFNAREISQNP